MKSEDFFELRYLVQQASRQRTMVTSMCEGKRRYAGRGEAERGIRQGKAVSAFRCVACHFWHVGATKTSREQRLVMKRRRAEALCE